jgi:hypothetical protein
MADYQNFEIVLAFYGPSENMGSVPPSQSAAAFGRPLE